MMHNFKYHQPTKIVFGTPVQEALLQELSALGAQKVLLVSDHGLHENGLIDFALNPVKHNQFEVCTYIEVSSNPTTYEVMDGLELAKDGEVDTIIALGGGSPIDVAKGIALLLANGGTYADYQWGGKAIEKRSWPLIAVPTTAGTGSEVTKVAVVSDPEKPFKKGVLSPLMFPHVAIIDPELTRGLPPELTAATGMDAFIHALEAYVGQRANPFTDQLALAALQEAWIYLPRAVNDGQDMEARQQMMLVALWGGMAMDQSGLGLIHALSGPLTTHLHLHHGLANGIILPYVLKFNLPAIPPRRLRALNTVFGLSGQNGDELVLTLSDFVSQLGLPTSLSKLGIDSNTVDMDTIAAETTRMVLIGNNPRPAGQDDCRALVQQMMG